MQVIQQIVGNVEPHWVGDGFPVRSLFSYADGNRFDPFLLLDYGGPYEFEPAAAPRGVGEHPHRGFETVTIVYQGELVHRDSSGSQGSIGPGDVQWMTAASGVVHEELHSPRFTAEGGPFEMVQLWVNLPAAEKMSPPRYQSITADQIPQVALPDGAGTARVIAGTLLDTSGPARTVTPINVWDIQLDGAFELSWPAAHNALLVVQQGSVLVGDTAVDSVQLVQFAAGADRVDLRADEPARLLVLSGEPLGEPVAGQGPFVMNTSEEIRQAVEDYRAGRMGRLS